MTDRDDASRLLSAVYAAPAHDEPRAAYAAWLTTRGDPLGRFVTAQLTGDGEAAAALLQHAIAASPIPVMGRPPLAAFERGFLATCQTTGALALPVAGHAAWRLIEHLRLFDPQAAAFVEAAGERLSALRTFEVQAGEAARALTRSAPHALEVLRIGLIESWFDLGPLLDDHTVVELGLAGVFEVRRDPGKVHLSPSALPFRGGPIEHVLRTLVRPRDEVSFVFMFDRAPVDAVRRALADIPHGAFTEHELRVVG